MTVVRLAVMAAAYAAGAAAVSLAAGVIALSGLPTVPALVLKALLVALVLVVVTWRGLQGVDVTPRAAVAVAVAALVGFLADPFTWAARTFVGQLVLPAGVGTLLVDLVGWLVVVLGTVATVRARSHERVTGYGR
ncbi:hypothetical protein J1G42_07185 [Cellulomonas sp. zg-ZUI222]|uniref:Uncharacterized protein n=1 Tax=Cellulomonas wangleii TaxID=2816956 RepID=A0ABX8D1N7_9CELL|nr:MULTISPECIES: hypothetical protein [Cellulomonas]MBO0899745.1 hypothetical protein [Cellulomonas sp. zg-ZUI22]MBO0920607.1 hypothetical protein [Cellulomonas wangleii]MBO0922975.1 hypothetical protein [Cellulomonas wangleii]QVI61365.1 hypothetical protein KG103_12855 [Cellulomonas wangleii]